MGSALDEAERALVTGSWSKASDAAATARRVARTAPDRVAAECVWVQAEYKLGRLGETHEGDARRVTGVGGDPLEPQTLLLWSRLKLADAPRAQPGTSDDDRKARRAEASAADALAGVFREAFRRRRDATRAENVKDAVDDGDASATARTASAAAWLYCVDVLCARRRDPDAAAEWLRANYASLPSPARESLADVVSAARAKEKEMSSRDAATLPEERNAAERRVDDASRDDEKSSFSTPTTTNADVTLGNENENETNATRDSSRVKKTHLFRSSLRETLESGFACFVEKANESFGVSLDHRSGATRLGAAAASAAAVAVAYAVVAETRRNEKIAGWLKEMARWV
jgi:hypothetical protein